MAAIREVHADGWCVRLDLARQVLRLEVPGCGHPSGYKTASPGVTRLHNLSPATTFSRLRRLVG